MASEALKVIPVKAAQARQYIEAVEGLVFDPQPYKPDRIPEAAKSVLRRHLGPKVDNLPSTDPLEDMLDRRYRALVSDRYYDLAKGPDEQDLPEDERAGVYGSPLYVVNERPSLLVDAGPSRAFQIDLRLVRDGSDRVVYSFLHLQQQDTPRLTEASLFMCSPGMFRLERNGDVPNGLYTPAFAEQQRLIAVNDLFRKHIKPTRS